MPILEGQLCLYTGVISMISKDQPSISFPITQSLLVEGEIAPRDSV